MVGYFRFVDFVVVFSFVDWVFVIEVGGKFAVVIGVFRIFFSFGAFVVED